MPLDAEGIGFGMAVVGGILAFAAVLFLLYVPTTDITVFENEVIALLGIIVFAGGLVVHAFGSD